MSSTSWFGRKALDASETAVAATGLLHKTWIQDPAAPLVLLVHGRAGSRDVMWMFSHALPTTVNLLLPEAFLNDPDDAGRSWWLKRGMTDEAVNGAAERLSHFLRASIDHYALKPSRMVALGFSQGSALLSVMMQESPTLFSGVAILAGFVLERSGPETAPTTRVFMAHGSKDSIIPLETARSGAERLVSKGFHVEFHVDDVEHKVGKGGMRELKTWAKRMIEF